MTDDVGPEMGNDNEQWAWPPDFSDEEKALFYTTRRDGDSSSEAIAAYNRVAYHNNPYGTTMDAKIAMTPEDQEAQRAVYQDVPPDWAYPDIRLT